MQRRAFCGKAKRRRRATARRCVNKERRVAASLKARGSRRNSDRAEAPELPSWELQSNQFAAQGLQGLQAAQGLQGLQAAQGLQGLQAAQGLQGLQAAQGLQGLQALQAAICTEVSAACAVAVGKAAAVVAIVATLRATRVSLSIKFLPMTRPVAPAQFRDPGGQRSLCPRPRFVPAINGALGRPKRLTNSRGVSNICERSPGAPRSLSRILRGIGRAPGCGR